MNPFLSLSILIFGLIYIAVPYSLSAFLVFPAANNHLYTPGILLGLLILIWLNDTGAYVFGMLFGKHRLFERISPKKSWEGADWRNDCHLGPWVLDEFFRALFIPHRLDCS